MSDKSNINEERQLSLRFSLLLPYLTQITDVSILHILIQKETISILNSGVFSSTKIARAMLQICIYERFCEVWDESEVFWASRLSNA